MSEIWTFEVFKNV